jgi:murein DD-endopeptidase MepM/ murein hydrolase activator NlpD
MHAQLTPFATEESVMFDLATSRILHQPTPSTARSGAWVWPLPRLGEHEPIAIPSKNDDHPRVVVAYRDGVTYRDFVPVFAAHDGVITFAAKAPAHDGATVARYAVCLDHPGGWSTWYGDLEHMFCMPADRFSRRRRERVRAGDVLGYAQRAPLRVTFELWRYDDESFRPIECASYIDHWRVLTWDGAPLTTVPAQTKRAA